MKYGRTLEIVRESRGLSFGEMGSLLGLATSEEYGQIGYQNGEVSPATEEAFIKAFGIPLPVVAWALFGRIEDLPKSIQKPVSKLTDCWVDDVKLKLRIPGAIREKPKPEPETTVKAEAIPTVPPAEPAEPVPSYDDI